ncbi:MAG TPA: universal stress protein [Mycobacteriales bacterium]|nr:universal stress protein [Mycobacteriales bacterium]
MSRIVVGVDGSPGSHAALRWAAEEASRRGAYLVAVHSWDFPYATPLAGLPAMLPPNELQEAAERLVDDTITEALGPEPAVKIERVALAGSPAAVLLEHAKNADLLVVGARGHGGFVGLLLGSVSHQVVAHATVPTVVVPIAKDRPPPVAPDEVGAP